MDSTAHRDNRLHWQTDWRTNLFTVVCLPLLIVLGFWQLERAAEKQQIGETWQARRELPAVALDQLPEAAGELAYRRVALRGGFLEGRDFLLDNRIHAGRYGVELITPFMLEDGVTVVLVNRGWMAADPARRSLPQIPPATGPLELVGTVYVPPGQAYTLGEIASDERWPRLVQAADATVLGRQLQLPVYPWLVRLEADSPAALVVAWQAVNTSPEKHRAYAVQWFAMALALALIFFWRSTNVARWWRHRGENVR